MPQPAILSTLAENGGTAELSTQSLPKHVEDTAGFISRPDGEAALPEHVPDTFVEKSATDILLQDQQLECVSEEEISTTVHEGKMSFCICISNGQYSLMCSFCQYLCAN